VCALAKESVLEYSFDEVWRFLNRYGVIVLELDGSVGEVRTGVAKMESGVVKVIRYVVNGEEVLRTCNNCWMDEYSCTGASLKSFKTKLIRYIGHAYIE
jgi:hypothetical protein